MSLVSIFWVIWRNVMYTHEAHDFWGLHKNMNCAFPLKSRTFEESSKSRGVFRTQASMYDGAFLWIYLTACYMLHHRCSAWLYIGSKNIEIFKVKLSCSKSSRLLQHVAFLVIIWNNQFYPMLLFFNM